MLAGIAINRWDWGSQDLLSTALEKNPQRLRKQQQNKIVWAQNFVRREKFLGNSGFISLPFWPVLVAGFCSTLICSRHAQVFHLSWSSFNSFLDRQACTKTIPRCIHSGHFRSTVFHWCAFHWSSLREVFHPCCNIMAVCMFVWTRPKSTRKPDSYIDGSVPIHASFWNLGVLQIPGMCGLICRLPWR